MVTHYPTGKLKVKFAEEGERYLKIGKFDYIRLPTFKGANPTPRLSSFMASRSLWDKLNKPGYFMDARKSLAVTAKQWTALSSALKAKEDDRKKVKLWEGEFLKPDDILSASWKGYKPAITKSMQVEVYEVGRRETGFNLGKFAVPLGLFIGLAILLIIVYGLFIQ